MSRDKRERERQENWSENLSEDHFEECSVKIFILAGMHQCSNDNVPKGKNVLSCSYH